MHESLYQFRFSSLAENWGVLAKLIYKYQILYLDCIMIVPWRHLVNDIDLCHSSCQGHLRSLNSAPI